MQARQSLQPVSLETLLPHGRAARLWAAAFLGVPQVWLAVFGLPVSSRLVFEEQSEV